MNEEIFAEWIKRQGHHVIKTASSYWYDAGPRVYQAFPYGWVIQPSQAELTGLLMRNGGMALRYSTPFEHPEGLVSYHVVLHNPYNMEQMDHRGRNGVKRGLSNCIVEKISLERLAEEGWILQADTLKRQNRERSMSQAEWQKICYSAIGLPGFEAWGASVNGELAATILTARICDTWYVPYAQSLHKFLPLHVNNALFFVASCDMLSEDGIEGIFYSLHSLDAPESINEFKFRMNFQAKAVRQRIVFNPWISPFANSTTYHFLSYLTKRFPASSFLSKAEGIYHFYLQGKRPLEQQEWPKCLSTFKETYPTMQLGREKL